MRPVLGLISLFLIIPNSAMAWKERREHVIENGHYDLGFTLSARAVLDIDNDYGPVHVRILNQPGATIRVYGTYTSDSPLWAGIQYLLNTNGSHDIFLDGPARFKAHDHVAAYGKPLDYEWFAARVENGGVIRPGEAEGEIVVADVLTVRPDGQSIGGRARFWGNMHFGKGVSLGEGACLGLEAATSEMTVEIPRDVIGKLSVKAAVGEVTIEIPSEIAARYSLELKDDAKRLELYDTEPCGPVLSDN